MTLDRRDLLVRTGLLVGAGALAAAGCRSDEEAATASAARAWTRGRECRRASSSIAAARSSRPSCSRRIRGPCATRSRSTGSGWTRTRPCISTVRRRSWRRRCCRRGLLPGGCSRRDRAYRVDNDGPRPALRDPRSTRARRSSPPSMTSSRRTTRCACGRSGLAQPYGRSGSTTSLPSPPRMRSSRTSATPSRRARGRSR